MYPYFAFIHTYIHVRSYVSINFSPYFRDSLNNTSPQAIAGSTKNAVIDLQYSNIGEDPAFGSQITFTLPSRFTFIRVDVANGALPVSWCK